MSSEVFLDVLSKRLGRVVSDVLSVEIDFKGENLVVKPRQHLGSDLFNDVLAVVREYGGTYVSQGKDSHFLVPLSNLKFPAETASAAAVSGGAVVWISTNQLLSMPFSARLEDGNLNELAASIRELGVLQPITVRPKGEGYYEIVMGQRRVKAAVLAGLDKVPCIIREMDDEEAYLTQLTENIQRHDLSDYEKARMLKYLKERFGWTHEQLAKKIGKDRTWVTHHLAILRLETEYNVSRDTLERLTEGQVRYILAAPEEKRKEIIERIKETGEAPSIREIEAEIRGVEPEAHEPPAISEEISPEISEVPLQSETVPPQTKAEVEEVPPEPKRSDEPYKCSDCNLQTWHPTFLKDGRVLCPTCLRYSWNKGLINKNDIAEEPPSKTEEAAKPVEVPLEPKPEPAEAQPQPEKAPKEEEPPEPSPSLIEKLEKYYPLDWIDYVGQYYTFTNFDQAIKTLRGTLALFLVIVENELGVEWIQKRLREALIVE